MKFLVVMALGLSLLFGAVDINTASKKELRAIPFSNWLVVSRIMKVRDQMELTNLDFLTKDEISDLDLVKLLLYVEF